MFSDPTIRIPIAISLGAIAGALSRYYLTLWTVQKWGTAFPYGTFWINISGCFLMGVMATLAGERLSLSPEIRLMLTTGFLGAYTTFSTYSLDTVSLLRNHHRLLASLYWLGSASLGILALQAGMMCAKIGKSSGF
jgi:fluoride exporter